MKIITDKILNDLLCEAAAYSDRDAFVSDLSTSSIWGDKADCDSDIPHQRIITVGRIWDLYHISIRDIRKSTGLSQAAFAIRFFIPRRTIENWESGQRECPIYTRLLLARACGLMDDLI